MLQSAAQLTGGVVLRSLLAMRTSLLTSSCLAVGLHGCTGAEDPSDSASDGPAVSYRLQLEPVLPENQLDLLEDAAAFTLTVSTDDGKTTFDLVDIEGGFAIQDLGELVDATLTFAARSAGGTLLAWGETPPLTVRDGDELSVRFLVARPDDKAVAVDLDTAVALGPLVADGTGRYLLFGGTQQASARSGIGTVWALDLASADASLRFSEVGSLPDLAEGMRGRSGHAATLLTGDHPDRGKILVTGGSVDLYGQTQVSSRAYLWDPRDDSAEELSYSINDGLSLHDSVEGPEGNVFLLGGFNTSSSESGFNPSERSYLYETDTQRIRQLSTSGALSEPGFSAAARLGSLGVLKCGGWGLTGDGAYFASDGCDLYVSTGTIVPQEEDSARLPSALFGHSLVTLQDGTVLLTGGMQLVPGEEHVLGDEIPDLHFASSEARIFDGESWSGPISMGLARAFHKSTLLPNGRVLVVGGITEVEGPLLVADTAMACAEIFDPATQAFTPVDEGCTASSPAGFADQPTLLPSVAADDRLGAVVVGGLNGQRQPTGDVRLYVAPDLE